MAEIVTREMVEGYGHWNLRHELLYTWTPDNGYEFSPEAQEYLVGRNSAEMVIRAFASHASPILPDIQRKIVSNRDEDIRSSLAANHAVTLEPDVAEKLRNDPNPNVRRAWSTKPTLSDDERIAIVRKDAESAQGMLEYYGTQLPLPVLQAIVATGRPEHFEYLAEQTDVPAEIADSVVSSAASAHAKLRMLRNYSLKQRAIDAFINDPDVNIRQRIAKQGDLSEENANRLKRDPHASVRASLASTTQHPDIVKFLASDPEDSVRTEIATRDFSGDTYAPEILATLANDPSEEVRAAVAANDQTPEADVLKLANDTSSAVATNIVKRNGVPDSIVEGILKRADPAIHESYIAWPRTTSKIPPPVAELLAQSPSLEVRAAMARSGKVSTQTLVTLAKDPSPVVRTQVASRKDSPPEALHAITENDPKVDPKGHIEALRVVVNHKNTAPETFMKILAMKPSPLTPTMKVKLLENAKLPDAAYPLLLGRGNIRIAHAVENQHCPEVVLRTAVNMALADPNGVKGHDNVLYRVIDHANCTPALVKLVAAKAADLDRTRQSLASSPHATTAILRNLLALDPNDDFVPAEIARHPNVNVTMLRALARHKDSDVRAAVAKNPKTPADLLPRLWKAGDQETQTAILENPNVPEEIVHQVLATKESPEWHVNYHRQAMFQALMEHPKWGDMVAERAQFDTDEDISNKAKGRIRMGNPDKYHRIPQLLVKVGANKLRQIRDFILAKGKTEVSPKELPPGNWAVGRNPKNGNISADIIQKHIDSIPPVAFNVSEGLWDGCQRHSNDYSKVCQVNLTDAQVKEMKELGVFDTYQKMLNETTMHPRGIPGIGWIRWTGNEKGVHIDEVQSDFAQDWVDRAYHDAYQWAIQRGDSEAEAVRKGNHAKEEKEKEYPQAHQAIIRRIMFGENDSLMLQEAFQEYLRTPRKVCPKCGWGVNIFEHPDTHQQTADCPNGRCREKNIPVENLRDTTYLGTPFHIPQVEIKAELNLDDSQRGPDGKMRIPKKYRVAYSVVPKDKMGMRPGQYGELETQTGRDYHPELAFSHVCNDCGEHTNPIAKEGASTCHKCGSTNVAEREPGGSPPEPNTWKETVRKYEPGDHHEPQAASIMVQNHLGYVLWGRRRKDQKWSLPGGHLEPGEMANDGAVRELYEETGLIPEAMWNLGAANTPQVPVHIFQAVAHGEPTTVHDPDREFELLQWVDCFNGPPAYIMGNLAHDPNVVTQLMGWQSNPWAQEMEKAEDEEPDESRDPGDATYDEWDEVRA